MHPCLVAHFVWSLVEEDLGCALCVLFQATMQLQEHEH